MRQVFSTSTKLSMWLAVEKAVLASLVADGVAPRSAFDALEELPAVDADAVAEREAIIHHDLAAFVDVVGAAVPESAAWLHYGLTSSDVVDTALALQLQQASLLLVRGVQRARAAVLRRAHEHRATVMLGRTHGMPAEIITFGAKLAGWWHQLGRDEQRIVTAASDVAVGKLSGAVGLYTGVSPDVERRVLAALGLGHDLSATQIVQRDRHAALLSALALCACTLERCAVEIRHLQRAEVGEASEPFGSTQKGSSAMPHKRNPIVAERICGLARVVRSHAQVGLENVALWHERDISHSSAERVVLPDAFCALDYMLDRFTWLVDGMVVDSARMQLNIDAQRGLVASQQVLLALVESGRARDDAYRHVQAASRAVHDGVAADLLDALNADPDVRELIGDRLQSLCDTSRVPAGVAQVFASLPQG